MNRETINRILDLREVPRPAAWISREVGVDEKSVRALLRLTGDVANRELPLDKYDKLEYLVKDEASISEIIKTYGFQYATIKRWFPDAGLKRGSEEWKQSVSLARKMRELEKRRDLL